MTISLTRSRPNRLSQRRGILNDRPLSGTRVLASMAIGPVNWSTVASLRRRQLIA
jgi:hypothetical protein